MISFTLKFRDLIDATSNTNLLVSIYYSRRMLVSLSKFLLCQESIVLIGFVLKALLREATCIHAQKSVSIGKNCLIAANCQIMDGSGHELQTSNRLDVSTRARAIVIEDNVWLGTGVIVLPGTLIKRDSVISAGSVVSGTIEENSLMVGNPARLKKKLI